MIQKGSGEKVFRKYEAATNQASARHEIEWNAYLKMGLVQHLNGSDRKQMRRVKKARIWQESCQAMTDKAGVMWGFYELGSM